jgi:hypothetical protein
MDAREQADREKRVQALLVEPLFRRGFGRPTTVNAAGFEAMVDDLRQRLAYMTDQNLAALEEVVAANPGGPNKDRFPIANVILSHAAQIQAPGDDASPLMRAVFAHALGLDAITGGWAPELLAWLRKHRRFPTDYAVRDIRDQAASNARQMAIFDERLARGETLRDSEEAWRAGRKAALAKCNRIRELGLKGSGA